MSKHSATINKVMSIISKRESKQASGLSFRVQLEGSPDEVIRTRGFNNDGNNLQPNPIQTEEAPNE